MARLEWFRLYTEARTDAKLRTLTDAEHRLWFHLLCLAAEQRHRGIIAGYTDELLAIEVCDGDTDLLRQTIEHLKRLRILREDDDGLTFIAFEDRQYDKPSDTPEATRARKAAQRSRQVTPSHAMSRDVTPSHVTSHAMSRDVTQREEERREEKTKGEGISSSGKDFFNSAAASSLSGNPTHAHTPTHARGSVETAAAAAWSSHTLYQTAGQIAQRLKLDAIEIPPLRVILEAHAPTPPYLIAEAVKCAEYYTSKRRRITPRLYDNWLEQAEKRRTQMPSAQETGNGSRPEPQPPAPTATHRSDPDEPTGAERDAILDELNALVAQNLGKKSAG